MIKEPDMPYKEYVDDREFVIETPIGSVKSDSGNHVVDIISVVGVIAVLYIGKMIISYTIKRFIK